MDDLISRQAAIDAAKKLLDYYGTNDISKEFADHTAERFMNRVPSAQPEVLAHGEGELSAQPEMIRCKECIYFDKYIDCKEMYQWDGFCADWARNTYENWYCSRAERRNDG